MKRDASLQPLSRQHHDALMACLMIEKGVRKNTDLKILQDFTRQFWEKDVHKQMMPWYMSFCNRIPHCNL